MIILDYFSFSLVFHHPFHHNRNCDERKLAYSSVFLTRQTVPIIFFSKRKYI